MFLGFMLILVIRQTIKLIKYFYPLIIAKRDFQGNKINCGFDKKREACERLVLFKWKQTQKYFLMTQVGVYSTVENYVECSEVLKILLKLKLLSCLIQKPLAHL